MKNTQIILRNTTGSVKLYFSGYFNTLNKKVLAILRKRGYHVTKIRQQKVLYTKKYTKQEDYIMEKRISGHTGLLALIGSPVGHSGSPAMYNYSFEKLGLDYAYVAFDIKEDKVKDAIVQ